VREQAAANKKIYCMDTGFVTAKAFRFSENRGKLLENLVAVELYRLQHTDGAEIFYWKNTQAEEVDFVVKQGSRITALIQVCADLHEEKTRSREIRALLKAGRELNCDTLLLLSEKEEGREEAEWFGMRGEIRFIPLWKWLSAPRDSLVS
jgi:predicted AAA+ superfamily ATPase